MTLRIVQVPDPAPGTDWLTTVPGEYLYDVIGVTAELVTGSIPPQLLDVSGNMNTGSYVTTTAPYPTIVPGAIVGDTAVACGPTNGAFRGAYGQVGFPILDWGADWTVEIWFYADATNNKNLTLWGVGDTGFPWSVRLSAQGVGARRLILHDSGGFQNISNVNTIPYDNAFHQLVAVNTAGTITFYVDGALVALGTSHAWTVPPSPATIVGLANEPGGVGTGSSTYDEWSIYPTALTGARIAAHYAAAAVSFAAYTAAVLVDTPSGYYHLDGTPNTGRQVCLEITDGHQTVALVPTGFVELATPGPWFYSWQPGINSNQETPAAGTFAVSIPNLILPAGYTIGSRTLDLQAGDQWTGIVVWWSSDIMDALTPINPYVFPPSVHLVYQQRTAPS
jgi:hypothetical protein